MSVTLMAAAFPAYHENDMLSVLVLALATAAAAPGVAPDAAVRLRWTAPTSCPDGSTVASWIAALGPAAPDGAPHAEASVTVEAHDGIHTADIEVWAGGQRTSRALHDADCMLVSRAAAVVIAVALDPIGVADAAAVPDERAPTRAESTPSTTRPTSPARSTRTSSTPTPRADVAPPIDTSRRRGRLEFGIGAGTGIGGLQLPAAGVGVLLAPFLGMRRWQLEAVVQYWLPRRVPLDDPHDVRVTLQMVTGGLRVCPLLSRGRVRVTACAGVDAGVILGRADGDDLAARRPARDPWAGLVIAPGVRWTLAPRVTVGVAVEAVASLFRPRFAIGGITQDVWVVGAADVRGLFTVQFHRRRRFR